MLAPGVCSLLTSPLIRAGTRSPESTWIRSWRTLKEIGLGCAQAEQAGSTVEFKDEIDFETFEKVDMTVCKVKSCENVKKSKKLLKFILDDGSGKDRRNTCPVSLPAPRPGRPGGQDRCGRDRHLAPRKMMGQEELRYAAQR